MTKMREDSAPYFDRPGMVDSFNALCDLDESLSRDCGANLEEFLRDVGHVLRQGGRCYGWVPDKLREIAAAVDLRSDDFGALCRARHHLGNRLAPHEEVKPK